MSYVSPKWWLLVMLGFAIGGAAIGLGLPAMQRQAAARFGRAGFAVFFVINIVMPLLVVLLSAIHPRFLVALPGTLLATFLFLIGAGFRPTLSFSTPLTMIRSMGPILLVACVMYHVLAVGTVVLVNLRCRVGTPPDAQACVKCGYKLLGLTVPRCPECREPFTAQQRDLLAGPAQDA